MPIDFTIPPIEVDPIRRIEHSEPPEVFGDSLLDYDESPRYRERTRGPQLIELGEQCLAVLPLSYELLDLRITADDHWRLQLAQLKQEEEMLNLELTARVLHRDTGRPTELVFVKRIRKQALSVSGYLPAMVRDALREMMAHEVDECLLQAGKRVRDPHGGAL